MDNDRDTPQNNEKRTDFNRAEIWSEYERSKTEILDRYYNINWFMPQYLNKKWFLQKNDTKILSLWRDNLVRLFYLLLPHEPELCIYELDEEYLKDIKNLRELTKELFNLESLKSLTSYAVNKKEPIKAYKEENYGFFE